MKIIIDTNILIDFSRRKKETFWSELVTLAKKDGHELILPSAAVFEFLAGNEMNNPSNREKAENLLSDVIIIDLDKKIAQKAADLFREYQAEIGVIDYFLAATAMVFDGELATLNTKHFKIFKNLRLFNLKTISNT
ncbi:MAG: PIN domain-containing protein [Patescibacteria group bacterium]|nr:PIN domain-containing protein [Patescibacteria group bacterium]